jgi:hypothetical protein
LVSLRDRGEAVSTAADKTIGVSKIPRVSFIAGFCALGIADLCPRVVAALKVIYSDCLIDIQQLELGPILLKIEYAGFS